MAKRIFFTLALVISAMTLWAQAAPKWAKKAQKSIVSVLTYGEDGNLLKSGTGFYIDNRGTAVADYSLFRGAHSAVVVDAKGGKSAVSLILGADDTYGVVRFRTDAKESAPLEIASAPAEKANTLHALKYSKEKIKTAPFTSVADTIIVADSCVYYTLASEIDSSYIGAPLFNTDGQLVAVLQTPLAGKSYALDINYARALTIRAIQTKSENLALDNIYIRKGLPETAEEAQVYLYFKSRSASDEVYLDMLNQFIAAYPDNPEGYNRRATLYVDLYRYDDAEADLQKYLQLAGEKAEVYSNMSNIVFAKLVYQPDSVYAKWTYDTAIGYIDKAIELSPATLDYKYSKGKILMQKKDYDVAYNLYDAINHSADRSPASYYAASLALEGRGDTISARIEMLDSAIAMFPDPMPAEAASFVLRRGVLHNQAGNYRKAVLDYNKFCYLSNNQVNASFYYDRAQIEVRARMYQQAIDDINLAISAEPRNPLYYMEKSAIMIRVNQLDECITAARQCITLDADNADAYRILGYALLQKGDKQQAVAMLQKAVSLGDAGAQEILEKYVK